MKDFETKISDFIGRHRLLDRQKRYLVALSGGADSVALLLVLQRLGYSLEAAHCNFHLRGEESNRDERFCETLCQSLNIPFHRVHFDTVAYADLHRISLEMAARELRYAYFRQMVQAIGAEGVCVAHHCDDVAETMLINLVRGTGLRGLTGIAPRASLPLTTHHPSPTTQPPSPITQPLSPILRPLLCVGRADIVRYLDAAGQSYITDSSNLVPDVVRNKIRLQVMPLLRDITPAASRNISLAANRLAMAEELFDEALARRREQAIADENEHFVTFRLHELRRNEYVLFECLRPYGFTSAQAETIFSVSPTPGQQWESPTHTAVTDRTTLVVFRNDDPRLAANLQPRQLPMTGVYNLGPMGHYEVRLSERLSEEDSFVVDKSPEVACLDADKAPFPLTLRPMTTGDRFRPYGMQGTKLLSDYLTDHHRSPYEKRCQLVLCDGAGQILWLVGERTSQQAAVGPHTRRLLTVRRIDF